MNKRPNKITICRFKEPLIEELGTFNPKFMKEAKHTCQLHNDAIIQYHGGNDLDNEFWFLNARIGSATHLITASSQRDYPSNDPDILDKLGEYLAGLDTPEGNAKNRGQNKSNYRDKPR